MGEIIRDWLQTRLGIIIDLSPEIFGHFARDGTLLAKVLHSYDVINDSQLNTLLNTQDPALSRVNLKHLRIWLKFVGVDCDNDCIEDISNGKGTMALRLFYKVFLCLENKDRLHFITLQKEREKYIPSSSKFDVTTISEEPEVKESDGQYSYGALLRKSVSLVKWQRKKYQAFVDGFKEEERFSPPQNGNDIAEKAFGKRKKSVEKGKKIESSAKRAELRELDEFARNHRAKSSKEFSDLCEEIVEQSLRERKTPCINEEAARVYTESLKNKRRREALSKGFKTRMQRNLLNDLWNKVLDDQEKELDELIAKKVLHQSLYEKQLIRKLCDIRNQKTRMAANRGIVEKLFQETRDSEMRLDQERAREVMVRENEEVEAERRRLHDLERRIHEQSKQRKNEKLREFGEKIVGRLIDIAMKISRYKIQTNENEVPESMLNQWKALFIKNQSIIDAREEIIATDDTEKEDICESAEIEDDERMRVLNDEDFDNYEHTNVPWKDFVPKIDDEVREYLNIGPSVLGYIVHKVLNYLEHDHQQESVEPPLPMLKTKAVVLGLPDSLLYEPIQELLKNSNVHLVRIENAINYCLRRYKEEMKDLEYIDLEITSSMREARNSAVIRSEANESGKKLRRSKKSSAGKSKTATSFEKMELAKKGVDEVTQTPRVIPHEDKDPLLSNAGYFGKWIHQFFTLGQPLSDGLISRTIVEYLKGLENVRGFVLVNYPNTRREMSLLESALGGRKSSENRGESWNDNENIDEIDSYVPRIIFEGETGDREESWTESRLFPNPMKPQESLVNSQLTAFVRIKEKSMEKKEDDDIWEILTGDATSVDAFYTDQEIASILYYKIFDLPTLKKLVRLLLSDKNSLISRVSSHELFGEYVRYFQGRREDDYTASNAPIVKKLLSSKTSAFSFGGVESPSTESIESRKLINSERFFSKSKSGPSLPGDIEWPWANFSQTFDFLQGLANHWRNLETSYVENMKEIFHLRRMNVSNITTYAELITRHMREFIDRPDKKQDLLHEFHRSFNEIHQDIRDDSEVKRELYCRIDDFETTIWEICDSRRREAEDEKNRIIDDHWTTFEIINIANVYIDILQNEIDRCNDTLQFINDYYTSMLKHPLQEIRSIVSLKRIEVPSSNDDIPSRESSKSTREKDDGEAGGGRITRTTVSKISQCPSPPRENLLKLEMAKLLSEIDEQNIPPDRQLLCYRAVEANVKYIDNIIETLALRIFDNLKREEANALKSSNEYRDKKKSSSRNTSRSTQFTGENERTENLIVEWRYAFMFEINRIRVRTKMLDAAARHDINHLVDNSRHLFSDIQKHVLARYNREVKSANDMATVFRFAVEEATPIKEEMLLDGDRFLVRSNVLMFPEKPQVPHARTRENCASSRFTASQLSRLVEIFLRSASHGILSERSFVYIIQDLIFCNEEGGENSVLPLSWFKLRDCDVPRLVHELFGDVEFIDWREFIIHAMGFDAPSIDDILNDFHVFRKFDAKHEEIVSRQDFFSIKLWFSDQARSDVCWDEYFARQEEREKIDATKPDGYSNFEGDEIETRKKILCEMFSYDDERVNYVALLMAFCRDDKPEVGLGKALSLAIGNKICVDWEIGEEYVRHFFEMKLENISTNRNDTREEAAKISKAIVYRLLKRFFSSGQFLEQSNQFPSVEHETWNSDLSWDSVQSDQSDFRERKKGSRLSMTTSPKKENESSGCSWTEERTMVYWLNFNVAQTLLAAILPYHAAQADVLGTGKSLRENLDIVRLELGTQGINNESTGLMILAHRFLHHDFIKKLLADSAKFTTKRLGNIIDKLTHDLC